MENFKKEGKAELWEDEYNSSILDRLEGVEMARSLGDCGGQFYVSTWRGYRIQLFSQTLVLL